MTPIEKAEEIKSIEHKRNFFLGSALVAAYFVPFLTVPALIATGWMQGRAELKHHKEDWKAKLKTIFSAKSHGHSEGHGGH